MDLFKNIAASVAEGTQLDHVQLHWLHEALLFRSESSSVCTGMVGIPLPGIEIGIAISILALGMAIALAWRPAEWVALVLIAFFALCHGHAHGAELPLAADPADYAIGFVLATGMIHLFGIGVGLGLNKPVGGRLARALGALIGVGGIYFLVPALLAT